MVLYLSGIKLIFSRSCWVRVSSPSPITKHVNELLSVLHSEQDRGDGKCWHSCLLTHTHTHAGSSITLSKPGTPKGERGLHLIRSCCICGAALGLKRSGYCSNGNRWWHMASSKLPQSPETQSCPSNKQQFSGNNTRTPGSTSRKLTLRTKIIFIVYLNSNALTKMLVFFPRNFQFSLSDK